jgi:hypothetical protein
MIRSAVLLATLVGTRLSSCLAVQPFRCEGTTPPIVYSGSYHPLGSNNEVKHSDLSHAAIAGIVIACVLVSCPLMYFAVAGCAYCFGYVAYGGNGPEPAPHPEQRVRNERAAQDKDDLLLSVMP